PAGAHTGADRADRQRDRIFRRLRRLGRAGAGGRASPRPHREPGAPAGGERRGSLLAARRLGRQELGNGPRASEVAGSRRRWHGHAVAGRRSCESNSGPAGGTFVKVLIVEDDLSTRKGLEESIRDLGGEPKSVGTARDAARALEEFDPRLLIVDIHLPDGDGIEVLRSARESDPEREGIVITGQGSIDNAIEALRAGAFDYLLKPLRPAQLEVVFNRLADRRRLESEVETLRAELQETGRLGDLVGRSDAMTRIF